MHRFTTVFHLGMPHTIARALSEVALLAHVQDLQWKEMGRLTGCPASRQLDAAGREVYASIFFVDVEAPAGRGLGAFAPDDELRIDARLGRFGDTVLDGEYVLAPEGARPDATVRVRLGSVLVALGTGPDDLRISTPANARLDAIPSLPLQPDAYRLTREALARGSCYATPPDARRLWDGEHQTIAAIDADRDLNGVGLLYFANYVAFLNAAERAALAGGAGMDRDRLDGRVTVRRRIGFYGNARASDALVLDVAAFALDADRTLLVHHRVRRQSDGRVIAIASAERLLPR